MTGGEKDRRSSGHGLAGSRVTWDTLLSDNQPPTTVRATDSGDATAGPVAATESGRQAQPSPQAKRPAALVDDSVKGNAHQPTGRPRRGLAGGALASALGGTFPKQRVALALGSPQRGGSARKGEQCEPPQGPAAAPNCGRASAFVRNVAAPSARRSYLHSAGTLALRRNALLTARCCLGKPSRSLRLRRAGETTPRRGDTAERAASLQGACVAVATRGRRCESAVTGR